MEFDLAAALSALRARAGGGRTLVLTHDNPDPDSLAAALGLRRLLEHEGMPAQMAVGGIIGRAENRAMVRELKIELVPIERLDFHNYATVALVDTQPRTSLASSLSKTKLRCTRDARPPKRISFSTVSAA